MLTGILLAVTLSAGATAPHPPLRGTLSPLRGARGTQYRASFSPLDRESFSPLAGRRWPEGPDEGSASKSPNECAPCHEDVVKAFAFAPHPAECAACHTVKKEHLESADKAAVTKTPKSETCAS